METVTVPEYVPEESPAGSTEMLAVPGVKDDDALAFNHEAEALTPQVVLAPAADTASV
jgi:hypothetical protein